MSEHKEIIQVRTGNKVSEHEVKVAPLTLICSGPDMMASKIEYPGRFPISDQETTYHAARVQKLHPKFQECMQRFFPGGNKTNGPCPPADPDKIRTMGTGMLHLMGLVDLGLKLTEKRVPLVFIHPESHLHPAIQSELADFFIYLQKYGESLSPQTTPTTGTAT